MVMGGYITHAQSQSIFLGLPQASSSRSYVPPMATT